MGLFNAKIPKKAPEINKNLTSICYFLYMESTHFHSLDQENELSGNVLVMPSLLRETMDMIFESYEYCELQDTIDPALVPIHVHTLMKNEMSRVTMRLTSIMAWLLACKAVSSGQLTADEALEAYSLEGEEYCLGGYTEMHELLPSYLTDLLIRSQALYERVWRLYQQQSGDQYSLQLS